MNVVNVALDFLDDHKSEIAFGAGVLLTGVTTIIAVKQTPKAMESIKEESRRKGRELTFFEKTKVSWKHYILPIATEVLGISCLAFGKSLDLKATGAALALADTSQKLLKTYSEKVVEEIGEKQENEIKKAAIKEQAKDSPDVFVGSEDYCLFDGDAWYYDPLLGKKFISSETKIMSAINVVNNMLITNDTASLNDFFDEIRSLTQVPVNNDLLCDLGDSLGFNVSGGLIGIEFDDMSIRVNGVRTPASGIRFINKETGMTKIPELII